MLTTAAKIFGVIMLIVGVLGFIPGVAPDNHLFALFHINTAHNIVHIVTGLIALWVGVAGAHASKLFFLTFGIIYGIVCILGFISGNNPVLGFMANNRADAWLHLLIAVIALGLGLMPETSRARPDYQPRMT
jgi:hypothetical protein